jgi:hypothetical protein
MISEVLKSAEIHAELIFYRHDVTLFQIVLFLMPPFKVFYTIWLLFA